MRRFEWKSDNLQGMNDTESAFYCNRARCHRQLGDLQKVKISMRKL